MKQIRERHCDELQRVPWRFGDLPMEAPESLLEQTASLQKFRREEFGKTERASLNAYNHLIVFSLFFLVSIRSDSKLFKVHH